MQLMEMCKCTEDVAIKALSECDNDADRAAMELIENPNKFTIIKNIE